VGEKSDPGRISSDPTEMFNNSGSGGGNRVAQLVAAIKAVNAMTDAVAGRDVRHGGIPDIVAGKM